MWKVEIWQIFYLGAYWSFLTDIDFEKGLRIDNIVSEKD